jgi:hypothetical protein
MIICYTNFEQIIIKTSNSCKIIIIFFMRLYEKKNKNYLVRIDIEQIIEK